ncbi:T9SS type A sorting domain-containing protein [Flavobacterium sp.]|uniref:T9SS type A sorting domain-containing protein n=1 Tax=Flavobacterium sp. TaxID=239 RepID=UPI00286A1F14|nr:T9SS type A sorting domain-containing protein [Flavobacterium sp.]
MLIKRIILAAIAVFLSGSLHSQIQFAPFAATVTGSSADAVAIGDLNNDGLNDVALGNGFYFDLENDYRILVYLQNTAGNLDAPAKYPYQSTSSGANITSLKIIDLNNDSRNDVVLGYGTKIGILYQNDSGTLDALTEIETNLSVNSLEVSDLNNDTLPDIAISTSYQQDLKVFFQSSPGTFYAVTFPKPAVPYREMAVADMNNDGLKDLVYATTASIHIYYQNNTGSFGNHTEYDAPMISGSSPYLYGIAVGDLNNDGLIDIAATNYGNVPRSKIIIWYQNASGLLDDVILVDAYDCVEPIAIADLNNDSKNEIIVVNGGALRVSCYEQDSNNLFYNYTNHAIPYATHYDIDGLAVGDVNNDGGKDLAIADYNNGLVILRNTSTLAAAQFLEQQTVVYPNPATDELTIDLSEFSTIKSIALFNASGAQLMTKNWEGTAQTASLYLGDLASGIYFLKIILPHQVVNQKIIKR